MRKISVAGLVLAGVGLAMLAWWTLLAAERAALRATEDGARRTAVAAAVAIQAGDGDLDVVALTEQVAETRFVVLDRGGDVVAGSADPDGHLASTPVPGTDLTVGAEVPDAGLGVGRFSHIIIFAAFLVMAAAVAMLGIVTRARRRAEAELDRLGRRWEQVAAADDLTGLGNRTRLLEDTDALIARGSRYGNSFGLALFEIQGDVPDEALRKIAETMAAQARGADLCYRMEGARFVTVLPEQGETGVTLAAERIRKVLQEQRRVEVRAGVAAFSPWLPCDASDLLTRAELDLGAAAMAAPAPAPAEAPAEGASGVPASS